jgi:Tfp pilus assembly protein PilN
VPFELFDVAHVMAAGALRLERPDQAAVAAGLALQGLGGARLPLNLLNESQEAAQSAKVGQAAMAASLVCLALIIGIGASAMLELRSRRVALLRSLEQREQTYQRLRPEVREMIQRQVGFEQRVSQLEQLVADGPALTAWASKISEAMPEHVWLTAFEVSKSGALHGLLEGRAKSFQDVTRFFEQLKTAAGMTTVKPVSTNVTTDADGKEVIAFTVQLQRAAADQPAAAP